MIDILVPPLPEKARAYLAGGGNVIIFQTICETRAKN
jgi:hypothetical protein